MTSDIVTLLKKNSFTISAAESITAGKVQALLASETGASNYFYGGITAYSLDAKVNLLNVDRDTASACNCVSAGVASSMARNVRLKFRSQVGVSTTGYAEEYNGMAPFAYIAISIAGREDRSLRVELKGIKNREEARNLVVVHLLDLLLKELSQIQ